jgi:hypothetical protein
MAALAALRMEVEVNMATLPLYQPTGFLPADIPRLDRADVKETAAQLTTITSALDRVSQFAFKKAEEQAEREGLQYGAENQPSAEQVMAAMEGGRSPQELFAEPGTTFGNAARKVQAGQLRNELEVKVRNEFSRLSGMVDAGSFNLKDVQTQIKAITDGYGRAISSISPEEGLKFRASAGSAGAPVYAKAADRAYKIYGEGVKANADDLISQTPTILADLMRVETDPVLLAERVLVERQRVFDVAAQTNDPQFFAEKRADFDRALMGAIVDYTASPAFAKNPVDGLRKMQAGDFGQLDRVMTRVNKDKLIKMYVDRNGEVATAWKRTNELNASVNADEMNAIQDRFYAGQISGKQVLDQARALGITLPDEQRKALISGEGAGANAMMYGQFESLADRQVVGESYFDNLASSKVITWQQANQLKKVVRNDNPEMTRARELIRNSLGVPDMMAPGFGQEKKTVADLTTQLQTLQQQARANGEPFNPFEAAQVLVKGEAAQLVIKETQNKQKRIEDKFVKKNITYDRTKTYTKEDLTRLDFSSSDADAILRIQKGL